MVICENCGSEELEWFEMEYPTGVVAPDGYEERWIESGWYCDNCGAITSDGSIPETADAAGGPG